MGESSLIVAQKANNEASVALSSLIHALYESERYALARLVKKDNVPPIMVLLAPNIEPDFESLLEVALPFAEDVRQYKFAPLDRIRTSKGEVLTAHRYLPSKELTTAMADFMDIMSLDKSRDADGILTDSLPPEDTFNFAIHRATQAIMFRAFHEPSEPLPPPTESVLRASRVPDNVTKKTEYEPLVRNLIQTADVKKVPPRTAHKKRQGYRQEPVKTGLDLDTLLGPDEPEDQDDPRPEESLGKPQRMSNIGHAHPLEDFQAMMRKDDMIDTAFAQIQPVILEMVQYSLGEQTFALALQCLEAFRTHAVEQDESEVFNDFLGLLQKKADECDRGDFLRYLEKSGLQKISEAEANAE